MSARLAVLLRHDVRLQLRYGIYYAYGFVIFFYVAILWFAAPVLPGWFAGLVIFTDPAVLGFFFLGALMMLEKAEGVRSALAITPVSAGDYFWSKAITLTSVALIAVAVLVVFLHEAVNAPLLLVGVTLTSVTTIGIGVPIALRFKTVTGYLIGSAGILIPIIGPGALALLDPMPAWAIIIPPASMFKLVLIGVGAGRAGALEMTAMLAVSVLSAAGCIIWALGVLDRELGRK